MMPADMGEPLKAVATKCAAERKYIFVKYKLIEISY